MSFFSDYLATAKKASAQTGVLVSVILAQWGDETGYGGSVAFVQGHNFAGVTLPGSPMITGVTAFQNNAAGLTSYIQTLNQTTYAAVRSAKGWKAQCIALGESPWAGAHYDAKDYLAGRPIGSPGIDLITIIQTNNLTQYDTGSSGPATTARTPFTGLPMAPGPSATATATPASTATTPATTTKTASSFTSTAAKFHAANAEIARPVTGTQSTLTVNEIILNGKTLELFLGNCTVTVQMDLSISKTSTLTLTIHDPTREVINAPELSQASLIHLRTLTFQLVSVEKSGSVLTCTFESFVVAALSQSTGPFTVAPNTMTRTQFAELLVTQVATAKFDQATPAYLYSLDEGYAHKNKEQLSRGTVDAPLEDSWTCLQRLANEIQWVCFESFGTVYFGPYSWLAAQNPVLFPQEFTNGITTITGTFDTGQPLGTVSITCVADSWFPTIGQCVGIMNLGPFSTGNPSENFGRWIVSEIERENVEEPTLTITLMQPLPGLPEPTTGGTNPAVGAGTGNVQTTGGKTAAKKALAFCVSKIGLPYVWGATGPTSYDCSGLVYEAYLSVGKNITRTTYTQWPTAAGAPVPQPQGVNDLLPGDLVYFAKQLGTAPEHVAIVDTVNKGAGTVKLVEAATPVQGIQYSTLTPTVGGQYGSTLVYIGALRPAA